MDSIIRFLVEFIVALLLAVIVPIVIVSLAFGLITKEELAFAILEMQSQINEKARQLEEARNEGEIEEDEDEENEEEKTN